MLPPPRRYSSCRHNMCLPRPIGEGAGWLGQICRNSRSFVTMTVLVSTFNEVFQRAFVRLPSVRQDGMLRSRLLEELMQCLRVCIQKAHCNDVSEKVFTSKRASFSSPHICPTIWKLVMLVVWLVVDLAYVGFSTAQTCLLARLTGAGRQQLHAGCMASIWLLRKKGSRKA